VAIEDGLIGRLQRAAADVSPINTITATTFTSYGAGTVSQVLEGGELAWRFQGPDAFASVIPSISATGDGPPCTIALRCIVGNNGNAFDGIAALSLDVNAGANVTGVQLTQNGGSDCRARYNTQGSTGTGINPSSIVITYVINANIIIGLDNNNVWLSSGAVTDPPDIVGSGYNASGQTYDVLQIGNPGVAAYDITVLDFIAWDRTLTDAEARAVAFDIRSELPVGPDATTSVTTGTAVPTQTEADIVSGGKTIILTLTDDTFVAAGSGPIGSTADTQAIIDGLDSAQSELTGWNNEVRDKELTTSVVRTSDTVATITLTASAAYDITATETITATIPASVLVTSGIDVVSDPTFTVTHVVALASITTEPLKNNTGQLLASESGVIADVYDTTNGALVVRKAGLTSDVSGVVTFTDAAMSAATLYRVVITLSGNEEGIARITSV
jgi:hypothetical protein